MKIFNPAHRDLVIDIIERAPFLDHIGLKVLALNDDNFTSFVKVSYDMLNSFGGIHGGAYSAMLDSACYYCAYPQVPENVGFISIDLHVNYLRSAQIGDEVTCHSHVIKLGRTIILSEGICRDQNDRLLAQATSKLYVNEKIQPFSAAVELLSNGTPIPPKFIEVDENKKSNQ